MNLSDAKLSNHPSQAGSVYNFSLVLAFVANLFVMIGISLLYRYFDFIENLGGTAWHLGWIVGISSIGAIFFRVIQGKAVDRLGPESIWIISLIGQIVAIAWNLWITEVNGISIYLSRTLYMLSVAGTFGAWLSFTSLQAPKDRIAEVIGVVGSSGFLGMGIGPWIGDWIFQNSGSETTAVKNLFISSAGMVGMSLAVAILACWSARKRSGQGHSKHSGAATALDEPEFAESHGVREGVMGTLFRYQPGFLLIIGILMGITIGFPSNFLRPWAKSLSIDQIKLYFLTYNAVAFTSRMLFRRAPQWFGLKNTILIAWVFMALSMLLYLPVNHRNMLWLPAVAAGLAHSFLFPSVVAACSLSYPTRHRGLATSLILAMYDLGVLIGMPAIGLMVTYSGEWGLQEYPATFISIFVIVTVTAGLFSWFGIRKIPARNEKP